MKTYKIYIHINKKNGKVYVGQTNRSNINNRFGKNGTHYYDCPRFGNAIKKYGWNNFCHLILEDNISESEVDYKERFYIKLYHSTDKKYGYNISDGGCFFKVIPIETRQKISKTLKGRPSKNLGRHHTEETKRKISEKKKGVSVPNNIVWTKEMRERQSKKLKGHKMPMSAIEKLKKYSGKNAVWYGRHHTKETKEKLRQYCGEKSSFYGKKHTQEYKDYMSKKVSGVNNQAYGKHWYTNGEVNAFTYVCPMGYWKGITKKNSEKKKIFSN
ncbi:MAG: hypothetical protein J6V90_08335 [Treponema sp.]|nr:hypothetical protein [Treponema sp.]